MRDLHDQVGSVVDPGACDRRNRAVRGATTVVIDAAYVVARLEAAGATLLAMPGQGHSTKLRQMRFDIVHTALEAYGWEAPPLRAPAPAAVAISDMDVVFGWLRFIPDGNFVMRRVVGARALVHPLTCRHLFTWRRLAATLRADHKSVQRWHGQGIALIVAGLQAGF